MRLLPCTCVLLAISFLSNAQQAIPGSWVTNGGVSSITRGEGKVFLGGIFDWVGPSYGSGGAVFNSTLTHDSSYPLLGKDLRDAEADGNGGWYVASNTGIVHLRSDKTIEELAVNVNGFISSLEKIGNILYIGGSFLEVNSVARGNLAAYDLTSGTLTSWNPNADSFVEVIVASGTTLYVGGRFTNIGGQARIKIAALDASTGLATSWNPAVAGGNGFVRAICVSAGAVYFGGGFTNVGSGTPARTNFAAVNNTTGALLSFNPRPNSLVYNLVLDGNTLYMTGIFSQVAATAKEKFAVLDVTTGAFTSMAMAFDENAEVNSIALDGQKLFLGGSFTTINGESRPRLAVVDKTTGAVQPMHPGKVSDAPYRLVVSAGNILATSSNYFVGVAGTATDVIGVAALDENTGQAVTWTPEIPALAGDAYPAGVEVHYQGNRVYFLQKIYHLMDGYYESVLGALNATDGSIIDTFEVTVDNNIDAWAFSEDALYLAGQFTEVNGQARSGFAAVDLATGNILPWTIGFVPSEQGVNSMIVHNNVLYVGGDFFYSDGEDRQNLAAWDATTGALTDWAPEYFSDFGTPRIGAVTDTRVYIIGNGIYPVDATTGESEPGWLALFNATQVYSMVIHGSAIYVGGYTSVEQLATLARLDITTGEIAGEQPLLEDIYASEGSTVRVVDVSDTKLLVGGDFSFDVNGIQRPSYAEYLLPLSGNRAPQIQSSITTVPIEGIATIDLEPLISDPDGNLDLSTLRLVNQFSEHGAAASLNELTLTLNYKGVVFVGTDHITIGICDVLEECVEQELTIEVTGGNEAIVVYNAVSPNGDDKNDFLMLENIESFGENKVTIFNRWGDLVFDVSGYNNADRVFKGINKNGNELPTGIYFYKIEYGTGKKANGYLSLKR